MFYSFWRLLKTNLTWKWPKSKKKKKEQTKTPKINKQLWLFASVTEPRCLYLTVPCRNINKRLGVKGTTHHYQPSRLWQHVRQQTQPEDSLKSHVSYGMLSCLFYSPPVWVSFEWQDINSCKNIQAEVCTLVCQCMCQCILYIIINNFV